MKFPPLMGVEVIDLILKSYHFVIPLSRAGRKKKPAPPQVRQGQALCLWRKMEKYRSDRKF
jgi:hypothetical protein